jgi:hypothetical protein
VAASKTGVRVEGVRELQTALRKVGAEAADIKSVHLEVASLLVPGVAGRTPVRTGALAESWRAAATKGRARITSSERYAAMVEYGVPERGIEPARMVRDTVDDSHAEILETYERGLERVARGVGFDTQ